MKKLLLPIIFCFYSLLGIGQTTVLNYTHVLICDYSNGDCEENKNAWIVAGELRTDILITPMKEPEVLMHLTTFDEVEAKLISFYNYKEYSINEDNTLSFFSATDTEGRTPFFQLNKDKTLIIYNWDSNRQMTKFINEKTYDISELAWYEWNKKPLRKNN